MTSKVDAKSNHVSSFVLSPMESMDFVITQDNYLANVNNDQGLKHLINKGDTLYSLGKFYGINYLELSKINNVSSYKLLKPGSFLVIPIKKKFVSFQAEDSLAKLAFYYKCSQKLLLNWNPWLAKPDLHLVGTPMAVPFYINISEFSISDKYFEDDVDEFDNNSYTFPDEVQDFLWPVNGLITSNFGKRWGRMHKGLDIWHPNLDNTPIFAAKSGRVTYQGYAGDYGNLVSIEHNERFVTQYAHLSNINVVKNQNVNAGELIGFMGRTGDSTGYHLHFEILDQGKAVNPYIYLPA